MPLGKNIPPEQMLAVNRRLVFGGKTWATAPVQHCAQLNVQVGDDAGYMGCANL